MRTARIKLVLAAVTLATVSAVFVPAAVGASNPPQLSIATVDSATPAAVYIGTVNSQHSITFTASGDTTWCNNSPWPPCTSNPTGPDWYPYNTWALGPNATAPGYSVGSLIYRVGDNGPWEQYEGPVTVGPTRTGMPVYVAYDDDVFFDNTGTYTVSVTRN